MFLLSTTTTKVPPQPLLSTQAPPRRLRYWSCTKRYDAVWAASDCCRRSAIREGTESSWYSASGNLVSMWFSALCWQLSDLYLRGSRPHIASKERNGTSLWHCKIWPTALISILQKEMWKDSQSSPPFPHSGLQAAFKTDRGARQN